MYVAEKKLTCMNERKSRWYDLDRDGIDIWLKTYCAMDQNSENNCEIKTYA